MWKEFGNALCAILQGDSTISDALGQTPGVFRDDFGEGVTFPVIRVWLVDYNPDRGNSAIGSYKPEVQIDIFADDSVEVDTIYMRIQELLTRPQGTPARIDMATYRCDTMNELNPILRLGGQVRQGKRIKQYATDWSAHVVKK